MTRLRISASLSLFLSFLPVIVSAASPVVAVRGDQILLDGVETKVLGLRCSNALVSDRATEALIGQLDTYKSYGLNTVSVFLMGSRFGDVKGYLPDGTLDPVHAARLERILNATAERGMITIVGCLYWSTSRAKEDLRDWKQADADRAIANTSSWLGEKGFTHVILDPDNEGMAVSDRQWRIESMIRAAKEANPDLVVANNTKQDPPNEDLNMHFGMQEPGKPWFDSEATPGNTPGGYWGGFSKETHAEDRDYYNYSRIGRYTEEMKADQLRRTREEYEKFNGHMLASTWLQCGPEEGVGGPFAEPGGRSVMGSNQDKDAAWNTDIDALHPDAGILWWLDFVRDHLGESHEAGVAGPPGRALSIVGNRFHQDGRPIELYGIRCASAPGKQEYTDHLIAQLDSYAEHGVKAVTVFYQGSSGGHYDPFTADGTGWRHPEIRDRMDAIIEACAERDLIVIAGIFYQWKNTALTDRSLAGWEASKEAVRTVAGHLRSKDYHNVILNIANEQNSGGYSDEPWGRVREVPDLLELVRIAKAGHPDLIVGCGGYDHAKNLELGKSPDVDVLLFDTLGPDTQLHSGHWYDHFVAEGITDKPIVNVESFGAWTRAFVPPGVFSPEGKAAHFREIADAAARPGLSVFLHSNPWCQGPADGFPLRFDLAGRGTADDPGIRWWFERVRETAVARFVEREGELVIEAENFATCSPSIYPGYRHVHRWEMKDDVGGFSGTGFMQVLPDERPESGVGPGSPRDDTGAGMTYPIRVSEPGNYHVFIRGYAMGGESNGLHVGLDGKLEGKGLEASNMSGFRPHQAWRWEADRKHGFSSPARLEIAAGDHTLHVWSRDDAYRLDKIVLRKADDPPSDAGPVESPTVGGPAG